MSTIEAEVFGQTRELSPFQARLKERRRITEVITDLVRTSRRAEVPPGLVTLVDVRFLAELASVASVTGERIYAVVDEEHLARVAREAGLIAPPPPAPRAAGAPMTAANIKAAIKARGWTIKRAAAELGVSEATIANWTRGFGAPSGERRDRVRALLDAVAGEGSGERER